MKIIVERHEDGYIAYPIGLKGIVIGEGDSSEEALADVSSAIQFHIETFGLDNLESEQHLSQLPNHRTINGSTLRAIISQAGISREDFMRVNEDE